MQYDATTLRLMAVIVAVFGAITLIALMLSIPFKVKTKAYFSLDFQNAFVTLDIVKLRVLKLALKVQDGIFSATVNGKEINSKKKNTQLDIGKIVIKLNERGCFSHLKGVSRIGGESAHVAAMNAAVFLSVFYALPIKTSSFFTPDFSSQSFDVFADLTAKISILDALSAVVAGKLGTKNSFDVQDISNR